MFAPALSVMVHVAQAIRGAFLRGQDMKRIVAVAALDQSDWDLVQSQVGVEVAYGAIAP